MATATAGRIVLVGLLLVVNIGDEALDVSAVKERLIVHGRVGKARKETSIDERTDQSRVSGTCAAPQLAARRPGLDG